jgi:hypothetical protein
MCAAASAQVGSGWTLSCFRGVYISSSLLYISLSVFDQTSVSSGAIGTDKGRPGFFPVSSEIRPPRPTHRKAYALMHLFPGTPDRNLDLRRPCRVSRRLEGVELRRLVYRSGQGPQLGRLPPARRLLPGPLPRWKVCRLVN